MAVIEHNGLMIYLDENGNRYLLYPITKMENVDGLEEALEKISNALLYPKSK